MDDDIPQARIDRIASRLDNFEKDFLLGNFDDAGYLKADATMSSQLWVRMSNLGIVQMGGRGRIVMTALGDAVQSQVRIAKQGA